MRFDEGTFVYFAGAYSLTLFVIIPMLPGISINNGILLCLAGGLLGITLNQHFKKKDSHKN